MSDKLELREDDQGDNQLAWQGRGYARPWDIMQKFNALATAAEEAGFPIQVIPDEMVGQELYDFQQQVARLKALLRDAVDRCENCNAIATWYYYDESDDRFYYCCDQHHSLWPRTERFKLGERIKTELGE